MPLTWRLAHGVVAAMSLAGDGDLRQDAGRRAWCRGHGIPEPLVLRQVHGAAVRTAGGEAGDALVTTGAACGVFGADCPPLVIAAPGALGVAHCGWRSTAAGVVAALVAALRAAAQAPPAAWEALVGPGVHPDDYEVDAPVLGARAWDAACLRPSRPGRAFLDLPQAIAADCAAAGITAIRRAAEATSRDPRLRSHRRHGPGPPQLLVAWRPACAG